MNLELHNAVKPLLDCEVSLRQQRMALHLMFALAVANIPENEIENYTAKKIAPVYLALCELLENVQEIS